MNSYILIKSKFKINDIILKLKQINVDIYFDEFYNDERNKVSFVKQTAHPDKKLDTTVDLSDEELPF